MRTPQPQCGNQRRKYQTNSWERPPESVSDCSTSGCTHRRWMTVLCVQTVQDDPFACFGDFNLLDDLRDAVPAQLKSKHELLRRGIRRSKVFANRLNRNGEGAIAPTETIGGKPQ